VTEGGRPVGLITFREAMRVPAAERATHPVADHMERIGDGLVVDPDDALEDVWPELASSTLRRALVVHDGLLAGLLSATDVMRLIEIAPGQSSSRKGGYSSRMSRA
jgi:CBS domain-containing protein